MLCLRKIIVLVSQLWEIEAGPGISGNKFDELFVCEYVILQLGLE